jgi:small subunit ribosomal protein S1
MVASVPEENLDMAQLLDEAELAFQSLERGQTVDGVLMKVDRDALLVNVGQKTEGVVPAREMRSMSPEAIDELSVGDAIVVTVLRTETDEGQALLSVDRAKGEMGWRTLAKQAEDGSIIEAEVTGYNRGGAVVTVEGVQGFVPLSQLTAVSRPPADSEENPQLAALVGTTLRLKVIEVNRRRNRAILSERAAMQEFRQQQKETLLENLREGEIRSGRVTGITNFGAFVDLGGADGLIHISELSWNSVRSPDEVVKVGDQIDAYVIKIDKEVKRIALSLKRTQPEPWAEIATQYHVGQSTSATITKLAHFGAFARIADSVEGLIHISELANRMIQHPREVVREGDEVTVKIVKLDPERRRIGLSMKQAESTEDEVVSFSPDRYRADEEHRIEQPTINAGMAAQLAQAMSSGQLVAVTPVAEEQAEEAPVELPVAEGDAPPEESVAEEVAGEDVLVEATELDSERVSG